MSWTFVADGAGANDGGGTTLATTAVAGVQAGDCVVVWASENTVDTTTMTVSDGTTSLTGLTKGTSGGAMAGQIFYLLASVATGSVTYTVTYSGTVSGRRICAAVYRPSGTVTFDVQSAFGASATGTTATSGTYTTAAGDVLAVGGTWNLSANVISGELLNGLAADTVTRSAGSSLWRKAFASGFTGGTAVATWTGSTRWICQGVSFLNTDGGGGGTVAQPSSLTLMGIQ